MSNTANTTPRGIVSPWTECMKATFTSWVEALPVTAQGDIAPGFYDFQGVPLALIDGFTICITLAWIDLGWPLGLDDMGEMLFEKPRPQLRQ